MKTGHKFLNLTFKYVACVRNYSTKGILEESMKFLNVAEKHDAAKTIAGLLSNGTARRREGYSVYNKVFDFESDIKGSKTNMVMTSVSGHLLQLEFLQSFRNWRSVDPQALFAAPVRKSCSDDFQPVKRTIEREIRSCNGLIVWTDCDREGENIGFEIIDVCRAIKPNIKVYRAVFSEITRPSVWRALQNLQAPKLTHSQAVDVRIELDLRTGAALTRFQTMRFQRLFPTKITDKLISYGSCQIPTLGFVVERYKEIEAFVSEPFWKIKVIHTIDDLTVEFHWARNRLFNQQTCEDYFLLCLADPKATVENVTVKPKSKYRPKPMDTVEMEKLGSRKLKLAAKEVMTIAEKLYTKGIISYPRTETNMFSNEIDLKSLVEHQTNHANWGEFAQRVLAWGPNPRNGTKSDAAHPPIHPTKLVTDLTGNEARVYELICRHFLACVSKDALGTETVVNIDIAGEKFSATGLCILERNYLDVYVYEKWNAKQIHRYENGQTFDPTEITMPEGVTTPPALLTEADLIALMEKHGIGTDATHAEHINTIKERGYIGVVDKGFLVPGVIGMGLWEGYDAMQLALAKPVLRAEFENDLKKICDGELRPERVLEEHIKKYKEAYKQILERVRAMDEKFGLRINETPTATDSETISAESPTIQELFPCPKCSVANLALKEKKNNTGHFIGCLNFPDCKNVIWLPDECKQPTVLTESCQKCGADVKMLKFKFQTAYFKSLFKAPYGWYKTCLRCDETFRNTFNINLESVKKAGPIVNVGSSGTGSNIVQNNRPNLTGNRGGAGSGTGGGGGSNAEGDGRGNAGGGGGSNAGGDGRGNAGGNGIGGNTSTAGRGAGSSARGGNNNDDANAGPRPKPKAKKGSTTTAPKTKKNSRTDAGNIRSYFSNAALSASTATTSANSNVDQLGDLFDSNDGFEEAMLEAASAVNPDRTTSTTTNTDNVLPADIATAFFDDEDDDVFANADWQRIDRTITPAHARSEKPQTVQNENRDTNAGGYSWGTASSKTAEGQSHRSVASRESNHEDPYAWGSSGFNNSPSRNNASLPRRNDNENFTWGSRNQTSTESSAVFSNNRNDLDDFAWGSGGGSRSSPSTSTNLQGKNKTQNKNNVHVTNTSITITGDEFDDSFTAVLRGDNNADPLDFAWGTGESKKRDTSKVTSTDAFASKRPRLQEQADRSFNSSFGSVSFIQLDEPAPVQDSGDKYVWGSQMHREQQKPPHEVKCTGCHQPAKELITKKEGPNKGRMFYTCPKKNGCSFFQWADEINAQDANNSQMTYSPSPSNSGNSYNSNRPTNNNKTINPSPANTANLNCHCGVPAVSFTVNKSGPNKGRPFFSCSNREKRCGFFKWGDEDADQASTSAASTTAASRANNSFSWGTSSNSNAASSGNTTSKDTTKDSKKRKCGLCRQEGHTKLKCPRKAEFEH